ncbi:MAG: phosphonate ABC transporter, permease protein PhnE [Chloroflexota bacterium]
MASRSANQPRRSAILAFILALIPGFGQIYAGQRGRGFAVLLFIPTVALLALWRMSVGGVNYIGPVAQAPTEAQVRAAWGLGIFLFVCIALVYLWSLWDAVRSAQGHPLSGSRILLLGMFAFFVIGWDVTEINVEKMITRLSEIGPRLAQIAWPWGSAFVQGVEQNQASVYVDVPCGGAPPETTEEVVGAPYLTVSPTCGDKAGEIQPNGERDPLGTVLHIEGRGFRPNEETTAWWEPPDSGEFRPRAGGFVVLDTDAKGTFTLDLNIPAFSIPGGNNTRFTRSKLTMRQEQKSGALHPSANLILALSKMVETIYLGLMSTLFGIVLAFPLSFLAAKNLMSGNRFTLAIYVLVRTLFNIIRSVEPLIWAFIFIIWVGLGPFAGTLTLALHTIASLGKLYSEAIENIEEGPLEAIQATGASWLQVIVHGVIPQVIPPFVSFTIYRWDINIRASTIIGVVGGGGIGFLLIQWIRLSDYDSAGIAIWLIGIVVTILDYASSQIREQFI